MSQNEHNLVRCELIFLSGFISFLNRLSWRDVDREIYLQFSKRSRLAQTQDILTCGATPRCIGPPGPLLICFFQIPLIFTLSYGFAEIASLLLAKGADPQFPNLVRSPLPIAAKILSFMTYWKLGNTPLSVATLFKHEGVITALASYTGEWFLTAFCFHNSTRKREFGKDNV